MDWASWASDGLPERYGDRPSSWKRGYVKGWEDADKPGKVTFSDCLADRSRAYRLGYYTGLAAGFLGYLDLAKAAMRANRD